MSGARTLAVIAAALVGACGGPREAPSQGRVLARWKGGRVTEKEFRDFISEQGPRAALRAGLPLGRRNLLAALIDDRILYAEAKRRRLRDDAEVRKEVTPLLAGRLLAKAVDPNLHVEDVPEEDVQALYEARSAEFNVPELFRFGVIQTATPAKARDILHELALAHESEEVFSILAHSDANVDPELRHAAGNYGYFPIEQMRQALPADLRPAFERLARQDEKPEIVQTPRGVFVVMTTGHMDRQERTYESIRESLRDEAFSAYRDRKIDEFLRALPGHRVERHDALVDRFRLSDAPALPDEGP